MRRIYIASLADYNAGRLVGEWIDCEDVTLEELEEKVAAILATSKEPIAEEYAIHDCEGFGSLLGECSTLREVAILSEVLDEVHDSEAMLAWLENECSLNGRDAAELLEAFEESYCGIHENGLDGYAYELIDDGCFGEIPESLVGYIDYKAIARDLSHDGYWSRVADNFQGEYVFRSI